MKFIKVLNKYKTYEEYRLLIFGILIAIIALYYIYSIFFGNLLYLLFSLPLLFLKNSKISSYTKLKLI